MAKTQLLENEKQGFDIYIDDKKVGEISHKLTIAVAPVSGNRLVRLGVKEEEIIQERWNFTTRLM